MRKPGRCGECLLHPPSFGRARAAFLYRFPVDRLIRRFKYASDLAVGRWLALALMQEVADEPRPDLLLAPPMTRRRLAARGFNPSVELARVVGRSLGVRCDARAAERVRETAPQPRLGRRERHANLRGAFRCTRPVDGLAVAIVDDVLTTGATAEALARALLAAGAREVAVWTVARTPPGA